jgi:DNA-3-methyladenine glycosylase II
MYLMFHLAHPDVLPLGDLAVRKGIAVHFGMINGKQATAKGNNKNLPTADDMVRLTDHWRVC